MDNRYWSQGCPPLMQDGRFITNLLRFNTVDQYIRNTNNINSSHDYRLFLQKNGDQLLNKEREYIKNSNLCKVNGKCLPLSGKEPHNALPCSSCYNNSD